MTNNPLSQPRMTAADWGLLLLLSIFFGFAFFFRKMIVKEVPPFTLVFVTFTIASGALWFYIRACHLSVPRSLSAWAAFAGMGALNNLIPGTLVAWSQTTIASGLASILIATTPIFSILAAHYLTPDEKMSANKVVGVLLGVSGVIIALGVDSLNSSPNSALATLACLAAAISYSLANVFGRRFKRMAIAPVVVAFGQLTATAVMMLPIVLFFDSPWLLPVPSIKVWASLAGLSLVSTALAYVVFFRILANAGGTNISFVTLLIPVSAILLGSVILGERLNTAHFAGMALIGLGLIAADGRAWEAVQLAVRNKT